MPALTILLAILFAIVLTLLLLPAAVFTLQVLLALPRHRRRPIPPVRRPPLAVLVPAHNEASGIAATLASVRDQLRSGDRLLVVADNCSDDTAAVARQHGAEVIERDVPQLRGKGYALDAGVRHLEAAPPEVLVIVDADCLLRAYAIGSLARLCGEHQRPVQALYLMRARAQAVTRTRVAELAWLVKNWLRPLGWSRLGLPCQLMGTGMAFPWPLIARAQLASGHIVEDLKLGLDCAADGAAPLFCPEAVVTSVFADNAVGAQAQRTRWEHGHLGVIAADGPRLLASAVRRRSLALLALALDLCVPPLALLLLLTLALAAASAAALLAADDPWPWSLGLAPVLLLGTALVLAWAKCGRKLLPPKRLAHACLYVLAKVPLYLRFLVRRQAVWISSLRDKP